MNVYVVRQRTNQRKIWNRIIPFFCHVPLFLVLSLDFLQIFNWRTVYRIQATQPGDPTLRALFQEVEARPVAEAGVG
jgi:hypothetical protein